MPFSHAPVGGQGNLVTTQIQSPNFNEETGQGWRISKDGSAYFADVQLPNVTPGTTVTFSSTEPASPNDGDIWYDTGNGNLEYQFSGATSTWVPYPVGTGAVSFTAHEIGGTTFTISPPPQPSNPNVGDIWMNSTSGKLFQWNGTAWAQFQYGANAIANASLTAAQLAAGSVTATQLAANAVGASNIQDLIITAQKFNTQTHTLF